MTSKLFLPAVFLLCIPIALASGGGLGVPIEWVGNVGMGSITGSANAEYIPPLWSTIVIMSGIVFVGLMYHRQFHLKRLRK